MKGKRNNNNNDKNTIEASKYFGSNDNNSPFTITCGYESKTEIKYNPNTKTEGNNIDFFLL